MDRSHSVVEGCVYVLHLREDYFSSPGREFVFAGPMTDGGPEFWLFYFFSSSTSHPGSSGFPFSFVVEGWTRVNSSTLDSRVISPWVVNDDGVMSGVWTGPVRVGDHHPRRDDSSV